jgi:hypothetical protein
MPTRLTKVLLVLTLLAACVPSLGGVPDKAAARALCDRAMQKILADDIPGAFELLKTELGASLPEMDTLVMQSVAQRSVASSRFGKAIGVVFIKEEEVADLLIRLTYVEKRSYHGYRWQFTFYKPSDRWVLDGVKWDDQLVKVFEP